MVRHLLAFILLARYLYPSFVLANTELEVQKVIYIIDIISILVVPGLVDLSSSICFRIWKGIFFGARGLFPRRISLLLTSDLWRGDGNSVAGADSLRNAFHKNARCFGWANETGGLWRIR